jgi:hypothetical protein
MDFDIWLRNRDIFRSVPVSVLAVSPRERNSNNNPYSGSLGFLILSIFCDKHHLASQS